MTAPDVRTAAQAEAEQRWRRDAGEPWRRVFVKGAVWGAELVSNHGIVLNCARDDGVYRDANGGIWQHIEGTTTAVKIAIAATTARLTPTREQIADTVAQFFGPNDTPEDVADAVLALMAGEA